MDRMRRIRNRVRGCGRATASVAAAAALWAATAAPVLAQGVATPQAKAAAKPFVDAILLLGAIVFIIGAASMLIPAVIAAVKVGWAGTNSSRRSEGFSGLQQVGLALAILGALAAGAWTGLTTYFGV